ncbi:MAG: hypothetical protein QNL93_08405, partial [Opitutae bacterium]
MKFKKILIFSYTLAISLSSYLHSQTIVPAGLGQMSVTQPSRGNAVLTGQLLQTGGQNPTVKIRWGDEDRGTAVTPSTSWDNEVIISTNQAAGSFSYTITIPDLDKTYYFRAIASSSGGTVVSRSLGVLVPSAPVGVANLQGRWNFDGENAKDSSGAGRHGTAKKLFSPSEVSSMKLWLDASDSTTISHSSNAVSQWSDKSGNANHATQSISASKPTYSSTNQKITFDGNDILKVSNDPFNGLQEPATIAVVKWNALSTWGNVITSYHGEGSNGWQLRQKGANEMLSYTIRGTGGGGDPNTSSTPDLTNAKFIVSAYRKDNVRYINFNGAQILNLADSGSIGYSGSNRSAIGGKFQSDSFGSQRGYLNGNLHEVVVANEIPASDIQKIEGYLAHKWNLTDSLPGNHPYKVFKSFQPKVFTNSIGSNSATATATLLETGGADTIFEIFYGTADKGVTVIGWDSNSSLPDAQN